MQRGDKRLRPVLPQVEARNYEESVWLTADIDQIQLINRIDGERYIAGVLEAETEQGKNKRRHVLTFRLTEGGIIVVAEAKITPLIITCLWKNRQSREPPKVIHILQYQKIVGLFEWM